MRGWRGEGTREDEEEVGREGWGAWAQGVAVSLLSSQAARHRRNEIHATALLGNICLFIYEEKVEK